MTELLQKVMAEIEKLPKDVQDAIACRLLAELTDEKSWAIGFSNTSREQWQRLAELVREEVASADTVPLAEVFSPSR